MFYLFTELHKLLESESQPPDCHTISAKLENGGTDLLHSNLQESLPSETLLTTKLQHKLDLNENFESHDGLSLTPEISLNIESGFHWNGKKPGKFTWDKPGIGGKSGNLLSQDKLTDDYNQFLGAESSYKLESFEPVTVDMKSIEDQIISNAR